MSSHCANHEFNTAKLNGECDRQHWLCLFRAACVWCCSEKLGLGTLSHKTLPWTREISMGEDPNPIRHWSAEREGWREWDPKTSRSLCRNKDRHKAESSREGSTTRSWKGDGWNELKQGLKRSALTLLPHRKQMNYWNQSKSEEELSARESKEREGCVYIVLNLVSPNPSQIWILIWIYAVLKHLYTFLACGPIKHIFCNLKCFSEELTLRKRYSQAHLRALPSLG